MKRLVFISKPEAEILDLRKKLPDTIEVVAHSFLQFSPVPFQLTKHFDIVFFSSPRSVLFFTAQTDLSATVKVACIGTKTAELLTQLKRKPDYIINTSGNPQKGAESFKTWCAGKSVLFPLSNISLRTISKEFDEAQKQEVIVYSTEIKAAEIITCNNYVFTSPSNVKGFLIQNKVQPGATVISWGKSTSKALIDNRISITHELENSSLEELIELLSK